MPLNQALYDQLVLAVNKGNLPGDHVRISNEGEKLTGTHHKDPVSGRAKLKVRISGESYNVCCPFCGDRRYRLSISYLWGVYDLKTGGSNLWLIHCYNEECQGGSGFHAKFKKLIDMSALSKVSGKDLKISETSALQPLVPVPMPANTTPLDKLDKTHPSWIFLNSRGIDPVLASQHYRVCFCNADENTNVTHRIIVPLHQKGMLCGWQARYVNHLGDGKSLSEQTPKWYTAPGARKGRLLFNHDTAAQWPFVVVMEGPLDVLKLGSPKGVALPGPGVALLGHEPSEQQIQLIKSAWGSLNRPIVLLLDGDAAKEQKDFMYKLRAITSSPVIPVELPQEADPGDCPHDMLWEHIVATAREAQVQLPV